MSYLLVAIALALLLPGCSSTWSRPATSAAEFRLDDRACRHMNARTVLISPPLARDYVAPDGYRRCMELAQSHGLHSIAFPGVSTGIFGYPQREAADTALATIHEFLVEHPMRIAVIMCTYDALATLIMSEALRDLRG